uniref:BPTI/Kunitz inhibitor domain-containing protein n=2 Tax=Parascaris univalens TaxID=6257 RepID=A0A914ZI90_PARUN
MRRYTFPYILFVVLLIEELYSNALECDPDAGERKPARDDISSYLYCNLEGTFLRKRCPQGEYFNEISLQCESSMKFSTNYDPFLSPQYQAPDDLCDGGIPMTQLSAPIICNPSISTCPDGYICKVYAKTGTAYCCQNPPSSSLISSSDTQIFCEGNQVTYIESSSGQPRTCELSKPGTCPTGFGCNLINGTITRCCGKQFGCPHNSAGLINPNTGVYVQCSPTDPSPCQAGFICVKSVLFNSHICCSNTAVDNKNVCPAGSPLGGGPTDCSSSQPCPHGYECITRADTHYCCPSNEFVCSQARDIGSVCTTSTPTITRYYFDATNGLCRSFEFTQCGGNENNFPTLQECEAFCVEHCAGVAPLSDPSNHLQECNNNIPCPSGYTCNNRKHCCPTAEFACSAPVSVGNVCSAGIQRTAWYYDSVRSTCAQFTYLGCGGTANRFSNKLSCNSMCIRSTNLGNCPLGMTPHLIPGETTPQSCTLNVSGTCGGSSSCVRSTSNTPICCDTTATCPNGRTTYIIPGSNSPVSCQPNSSNCPAGNECLQSSIRGFYLCCSSWNRNSVALKPAAVTNSCPKNIRSNGQSCTVNAVDECPVGYTCIPRKNAPQRGICCAIQPICLLGKAKFIRDEQVQICGPELDVCPEGTSCIMSSISSVFICCHLASPIATTRSPQSSPTHRCANGRTPFFDPGSRFPRQCITTLRGQCPRSFACKSAQSGGLFYCCPVSPNECANGQKAFIPAGVVSPTDLQFLWW